MMSIKEKAEEYSRCIASSEYTREDFVSGANYVLDAIKNYINNIDLGNSAEEKFYKLDVIADIGLFIEQLKK